MADANRQTGEDIILAQEYLAAKGIAPGPSGYDEATLARAIQARGWDYSFQGRTGNWTAEVHRQRGMSQHEYTQSSNQDRETALLMAFAMALDAESQGEPDGSP